MNGFINGNEGREEKLGGKQRILVRTRFSLSGCGIKQYIDASITLGNRKTLPTQGSDVVHPPHARERPTMCMLNVNAFFNAKRRLTRDVMKEESGGWRGERRIQG